VITQSAMVLGVAIHPDRSGRRWLGLVRCCEQCGCEFPESVFEFVGFFDHEGQSECGEDARYPVEALSS